MGAKTSAATNGRGTDRNRGSGFTDPGREYIEMNAIERRDARRWSRVAFAALAVAAVSAVGNIYQSQLPRQQPYVIVEKGDGSLAGGQQLAPAARPDQAWVKYQLARWIIEERSVSSDPIIQISFANHTASVILANSPAQTLALQHARDVASGAPGQRVTVKLNFVRPDQGSDHVFDADWTETAIDTAGRVSNAQHWNAAISVAFTQGMVTLPNGGDPAYSNPYGMYISDLIWNREAN
jgi:type IV secretory pathway TrbF-like protein